MSDIDEANVREFQTNPRGVEALGELNIGTVLARFRRTLVGLKRRQPRTRGTIHGFRRTLVGLKHR